MAQTYAPGACSLVPGSKTCVDSTPCKTSPTGTQVCLAGAPVPTGGVAISQTCWQYSYQYACASDTIDTCSTFKNDPNCQVLGSTCQDTTPATGQCNQWQYTYQCQTQAAQTQQQLTCSGSLLSVTMPTPSNPNNTFSQAAVAQELLNQGGTYSSGGLLFGGVPEFCTKGYYGLKNCCKAAPGAKTNAAVTTLAMSAAGSVIKYAGSVAVDMASPYVYDAMFSAQNYVAGLVNSTSVISMPLGTNLAASGFSFGAYGVTYSTVAPAAGSGLMGGSTGALFGNSSTGFVSFNPYVFAAMVAVAVIQDLMSCTSDEQLLAMHKGAGLSTYLNEFCSNSVPILGCLEYTDNYCSFNSVLAEIINIQGKTQLGLNISDCKGITPAQLSQINFSKIDFGQFTQSLMQSALNHAPTSSSMSSGYSAPLQNTKSGSSQSTTSSALPAY